MTNRVVLVGRVAREPDHRTTATGKSVVELQIAVKKRMKPSDPSERDADFFRVKGFNSVADFVHGYVTKGRLIAVDGRLEARRFTDKDGNPREIIEIVADNLQALDRPTEKTAA